MTTDRDQLREALRNYPDWLSTLNNIVRALEDEGDRVFLGSTNDADDLREVVKMLDALSHAKALATPDQAVMDERERAWSAGWDDCKACLTDDEAFCLTDDVKADAWADAAIRGEPK